MSTHNSEQVSSSRNVALCYINQSESDDVLGTNNPEQQRTNILAVCERHGWTPEWYVESTNSEGNQVELTRQQWSNLKHRLGSPDVVAVVVNGFDAIPQVEQNVFQFIDEYLDGNRVRLLLAAPNLLGFDTAQPFARVQIAMLALANELCRCA